MSRVVEVSGSLVIRFRKSVRLPDDFDWNKHQAIEEIDDILEHEECWRDVYFEDVGETK